MSQGDADVVARQVPQPTTLDKLSLIPVVLQSLSNGFLRLASRSFIRGPKQKAAFRDVVFAILRVYLSSINVAQEHYMNGTTEKEYDAFMKKRKLKPETEVTNSHVRVHWLGSKDAKITIIFYHGGGFSLAASPGHFIWLQELIDGLAKHGLSVNVALPSYTLAPAAQYPTQIVQAAEVLNWLIKVKAKNPENIVLMGDSAGGNLATAVLSHILHPHSKAPPIQQLSGPFPAAVLICPWTKFSTDDPSIKRNQPNDMVTPAAAQRWSKAYLGDATQDNYNQPYFADKEWFSGLDGVVKEILVYGGALEGLIDSIEAFAKKLQSAHPHVQLHVQPGAAHDDILIDKTMGYTEKGEGTLIIESWLADRLPK